MINVGKKSIGKDQEIFIIAEIGLNHNQDLSMALDLIDVASDSGCSAAKFQTFTASEVYVDDPRTGVYELMGKSLPIYDLHKSLEMPSDWIPILKEKCEKQGIEFFSAPIGLPSLNLLMDWKVNLLKISSYECTNLPFLRIVAESQLPTILSTGACTLSEVDSAVTIFKAANCPLILLHCVTKYPAEFKSANLSVIQTLKLAFDTPVGFSDNGFINKYGAIDYLEVPIEAAKTGADAFEIHITLDRNLPGPDHGFATEPAELKELVKEIKEIRKQFLTKGLDASHLNPTLQGSSRKVSLDEEQYVRNFAFKCLFANRDIQPGERIDATMVSVLRPGQSHRGLEPKYFELVTQYSRAKTLIKKNDPITWDKIL